ncbi:flavodoxin [Sphingobacterium paramultivorum]|uniref:Flavodoxin n=1 Tax=Sphingobacterium paramultivorum TaxID=2886510 RepID=A0A7G5DYZ8_9SPHI|nr:MULTISPECIES: flavodoxin [Sphingobacterium]MCS4163088.1 flavodoxin [Sphingobacterium sp. BIGb0116]QMV66973.1 flavodoxin [Sphingobacterium paramultivorum]WSO15811.1 flavodoxin [Sphingobacterium paramultivorum]
MKTRYLYCLLLCLLFAVTSCSGANEATFEATFENKGFPIVPRDSLNNQKVLIVYLSRTKNTKAVAEIIHRQVGGDLVGLELENPYPTHYQTAVDQVAEENKTGYLPPLKTKIDNIGKYDFIFVGFPTWGMQLPPPIKSFLKQYDLAGKTIVPFNTNAGYGVGSSFDTIKQLCSKSKILEGFTTKAGKERDGILFVISGEKEKQLTVQLAQWLEKLGFTK